MNWLPEELHPVAMRLARADALAYELALTALAWSRGPNDEGAITLRQVERTPGTYDVDVTSIRPVPPLAAMLFSEAVHHLRAAVDNALYYVAEKEHGQPFTPDQARAVAMPTRDDPIKFAGDVKRMTTGRNALAAFAPDTTLGKRVASLQPFNDSARVPSMSPRLAAMMGVTVVEAHPLALLRDYSNEDKHREIRLGAAGLLTQVMDSGWTESIGKGMQHAEVGMTLATVTKGIMTAIEISPALQVRRPDGTWVAPGPELDEIARHVADVVIPTLLGGFSVTGLIPAHIDLSDNGETLPERLAKGGKARAHERVQSTMAAALLESEEQDWKFPIIDDAE